jgi:GcrA cell cycle regulator
MPVADEPVLPSHGLRKWQPATSPWTVERDDELRTHWELGLSAGAIGRLMGMTKNQVIGRANRINLPPRQSPIKPRDPHAFPEPAAKIVPLPEPVRGCQYIAGEPKGIRTVFCGSPKKLGSPYCASHHSVCFVPPTPRRLATIDRAAAKAAPRDAA